MWRHAHADAVETGWSYENDPYQHLSNVAFYAPYATRPDELRDIRRLDETHDLVDVRVQHKRLQRVLLSISSILNGRAETRKESESSHDAG
ncbi:MAG: hypothetical protein ACLQUY_10395 [Ktedonobacterales bacterium]